MYGNNTQIRFGGPITPVVKRLMIINGAIFLVQQIVNLFQPHALSMIFGLSHTGFAREFMIWQIFTYMFLHGGWLHILFNLFALWMFAGELEQRWGSSKFLKYYLYTGTGAGIFIALMNFFIASQGMPNAPTIGASGAIYAILLGYGMTWPDREVLIYFLFPIKMKYLVLIFGLIEFFGTLSSAAGQGGNISHIGHLGGIISGFILLTLQKKRGNKSPFTGSGKAPKKKKLISDSLKKIRLRKKQKEIETRIKAKKIIDKLLEKIARTGMSSLTPEEKKELEWARKHYYPEGNDTVH